MKTVIAGNQIVTIDDNDYEEVSKYIWCSRPRSDGKGYYAYRYIRVGPRKYRKERLHCFLMKPEPNVKVDHRDGDGLNNQRINLRYATQQQNSFNQKKRQGASSQFKGVIKARPVHGKYQLKKGWHARIRHNNKLIDLGHFITEEEAALAYNIAAVQFFGEFACLNQVGAAQ